MHQLEILPNKVKLKRAGKTKYKEDYTPSMQARLLHSQETPSEPSGSRSECTFLHGAGTGAEAVGLVCGRTGALSESGCLLLRVQVCGARGGGDAAAQGLFLALGSQLVFMLVRLIITEYFGHFRTPATVKLVAFHLAEISPLFCAGVRVYQAAQRRYSSAAALRQRARCRGSWPEGQGVV